MSDSALDSTKEIQKGFSMVRYCARIENVLLVEGATDAEFYKNFTKKTIHYGSPDDEDSIIEIVDKKRKENKTIYGIIDRDYKPKQIDENLKNYLFVIDAHSLETMLIKYIKPDNFEKKIIRKRFYKSSLINNITEDSLHWAFNIGCLRKASEIYNFHLPFNKQIKEHDYFKKYILKNENTNKFEFNFNSFLSDLLVNSKYTKNDIRKYIEPFSYDECWIICRGHDIFDFIDALIRISYNNKRVSSVPNWEYELFSNYKNKILKSFEGSELKSWFNKIK